MVRLGAARREDAAVGPGVGPLVAMDAFLIVVLAFPFATRLGRRVPAVATGLDLGFVDLGGIVTVR